MKHFSKWCKYLQYILWKCTGILCLNTQDVVPVVLNSCSTPLHWHPCWPLVLCGTTTSKHSYRHILTSMLADFFFALCLNQIRCHCVWLCQLPKDHLWAWGLRDRVLLPLQTAVASQPDMWHSTATKGPNLQAEEFQVLLSQLQPREWSCR